MNLDHTITITERTTMFDAVVVGGRCSCGGWSAERTARDADDVDRCTDQLERLGGSHLRQPTVLA